MIQTSCALKLITSVAVTVPVPGNNRVRVSSDNVSSNNGVRVSSNNGVRVSSNNGVRVVPIVPGLA